MHVQVSLADCKEKCSALLASPGLLQLIQLAGTLDSLPAASKRGLLKVGEERDLSSMDESSKQQGRQEARSEEQNLAEGSRR